MVTTYIIFGVLGYLYFGADTAPLVLQNIKSTSYFFVLVRSPGRVAREVRGLSGESSSLTVDFP